MEELRLDVVIDPKLERGVQDAVAFGDFVLVEGNHIGVVYPELGLPQLFTDLILGRPLPLTFVTRGIHSVGALVAVALFLHRDLAIHPRMPSMVMAATLVEQFGHAGLAHIDRDLARFFQLLREYLPPKLTRQEQQQKLQTAVGWIRQYVLEEALPGLGSEAPPPRVLDWGTDGFVVAEMPDRRLEDGWIELFRQGHLRGVLIGPERQDRRLVLAARKSAYVGFDLARAAVVLNEAEQAMGEEPTWEATELWLGGPSKGTLIPVSGLLDVFLRV